MMYPILCNVRYETLHTVLGNAALWKQVALSLVLNWIVAPLFMVCIPDLPSKGGLPSGRRLTDILARSGMGFPPR